MLLSVLQSTGQSVCTTKMYLIQNVSSSKNEKPWSGEVSAGTVCLGLACSLITQLRGQGSWVSGRHRFPRAAGESKPPKHTHFQFSACVVHNPSDKASHMASQFGRSSKFYPLPSPSVLSSEAECNPADNRGERYLYSWWLSGSRPLACGRPVQCFPLGFHEDPSYHSRYLGGKNQKPPVAELGRRGVY